MMQNSLSRVTMATINIVSQTSQIIEAQREKLCHNYTNIANKVKFLFKPSDSMQLGATNTISSFTRNSVDGILVHCGI